MKLYFFAARLLMAMAFGLTSFTPVMASETGATLANPAAVYCVENGGHYGIRQTENAAVGICMKEDGTAQDAWELFREQRHEATELANPAATFCVANGGAYSIEDSSCTLADGRIVNAWDYLRDSHKNASLIVNPAAAFCLEQGGSYRIQTSEDGSKSGMCQLSDGSEVDAWAYFRTSQK